VKYDVLGDNELQPGQMRAVRVGNVAVVVVRTPDGEFHALRDSCSHYGARLSQGMIQHMVVAREHGAYQFAEGQFIVRCPWHGHEFDVATGRCPADPEHARVRAYEVSVVDGRVLIDR
jgi:3-phenylpropionate/trans-cinnamate dioxygenase ferredoxin subunit